MTDAKHNIVSTVTRPPQQLDPSRSEARLLLVYPSDHAADDGAMTSLVLTLSTLRLGRGEPIVLIDGNNSFDAYQISRTAQWARMDPEPLLKRMFVSRAFTCYQMDTLIRNELPKALRRYGARCVVILGLLGTFYDESVSLKDAAGLLRRVLAEMQHIVAGGSFVLAVETLPPKPAVARVGFLRMFHDAANAVIRTERDGSKFLLRQEKGSGDAKQWTLSPGTLPARVIGEPDNGPHVADIHPTRSLRS